MFFLGKFEIDLSKALPRFANSVEEGKVEATEGSVSVLTVVWVVQITSCFELLAKVANGHQREVLVVGVVTSLRKVWSCSASAKSQFTTS